MVRTTSARFRSASFGSFCEQLNNNNNNSSNNNSSLNAEGSNKSLRKGSSDLTRKGSIDITRKVSIDITPVPTGNNSSSNATSDTAARRLLEILLQMRDSRGRGLLHQITSSSSSSSNMDGNLLSAANALLQRADAMNLLNEFLTQTDYESGYTPLHWAILHGNLAVILLLLRFPHERFHERPMQQLLLLGGDDDNDDDHRVATAKDWEGLTPFRLLSQLQVKTLAKIREQIVSMSRSSCPVTMPHGEGRNRASSFSVHDDDHDDHDEPENEDDFSTLRQSLGHLQSINDDDFSPFPSNNNNSSSASAGAEVMTFGAAHHAALGVSDTTKNAHHTNRPRRVTLPDERRRTNHAVQVAAAAHHTLVLTKQGHVYACGLGKGGRLGTSGREQSTPIPLRVRGSLAKRRVVFIAAAENHSLCVTREGHVYSWGSNRFGQLDGTSSGTNGNSGSNNTNNASSSFRCLPQRIVDLKSPCIAVAAGERHSVAMTRQGEVYTWGDNAAGQLGRNCSSSNRKNGIDRVEALWSCERIAIQVAASEQSTLILIAPSPRRGLPVNSVYTWGHGNSVPIKVTFQAAATASKSKSSLNTQQNGKNDNKSYHHRHNESLINPIDIACAKHHNVAATQDGKVYTWGLHAESLASKQSSSSLVVASPVLAMLPERGGGLAVAVSASDQVTAVVTKEGHLYTWGATNGKDVMGHEGLRWQPSPKRVPSVHRAIGIAVAKEHTVLLIGASYPAVPPVVSDSSLESMAARQVCRHVDMFNVIPIAIMAERSHSWLLQEYCQQFIQENLDVVLTFGRKSEMDVYLNEQLTESRIVQLNRDAAVHPLVSQVVMAGSDICEDKKKKVPPKQKYQNWLLGCQEILDNLPVSTLVKYQRPQKRRMSSFHESQSHSEESPRSKQTYGLQTGLHGCSERCLMLTANLASLQTDADIKAKFECLSKELRGIRKRLAQTTKLQVKGSALTTEEREKLNRKPLLEADLAQLTPALQKVEKLLSERNLDLDKAHTSLPVSVDKEQKEVSPEEDSTVEAAIYYCGVCDVSCPDANHLQLHQNGRKHRNRVKQLEDEEKEQTAASIVQQNQQQAFLAGATPSPIASKKKLSSPWSTEKPAKTVQPRYQLAPPPVPPGPLEPAKEQRASLRQNSDFRSILAEEEGRKGTLKPAVAKLPKGSPSVPLRKQSWSAKEAPSKLLTPGPVAPLQNAPWANSSVIQVSVSTPTKAPPKFGETSSKKRNASSGKKQKQSLSHFLNGPAPVKVSSAPVVAPWSPSPVPARKIVPAMPSPAPNSQSLLEIQQEEEAFVKRQAQHAAKEGKWYLERTDRANNFSAIQERETEEREMRLLIQEQMQIEAQILREQQEAKKSALAATPKKANKKRNGNTRNRSASHPQGSNSKKDPKDAGKKNRSNSNAGKQQSRNSNSNTPNKQGNKSQQQQQQQQSRKRNQKNNKKSTAGKRNSEGDLSAAVAKQPVAVTASPPS